MLFEALHFDIHDSQTTGACSLRNPSQKQTQKQTDGIDECLLRCFPTHQVSNAEPKERRVLLPCQLLNSSLAIPTGTTPTATQLLLLLLGCKATRFFFNSTCSCCTAVSIMRTLSISISSSCWARSASITAAAAAAVGKVFLLLLLGP
jgi:hypothetical protein